MAKILVIEDEFNIRDLYVHILQQAGFEAVGAEDGIEGVNLAADHPNLILLDVMLPRLNGIEVLQQLKANPQTAPIPVVLITNLGQDNIIKKAFELGAQGYFLKMHIDPQSLVENVKKFIAEPKYTMDINTLDLD